MAADGTLADSPWLLSSAAAWAPQLAFGGGVYLLTYQDESDWHFYGELVSTNGDILSPAPFPIPTESDVSLEQVMVIAFDGVRFIATWRRMDNTILADEILYTTVSTTGEVGQEVLLASGPYEPFSLPSIAGGSNGKAMIAYADGEGRVRVRLTETVPSPKGGGCHSDVDCQAGTCVDNVCCGSLCAGGPADCLACSVGAGASVNGQCAPIPDGRPCGNSGICAAGSCQGSLICGAPDGSADARSSDASLDSTGGVPIDAGGGVTGAGRSGAQDAGGRGAGGVRDAGGGTQDAGARGAGGVTGVGGNGAQDAGGGRDAPIADGSGDHVSSKDGGGCSCTVTDSPTSRLGLLLASFLTMLGRRRRRRRCI